MWTGIDKVYEDNRKRLRGRELNRSDDDNSDSEPERYDKDKIIAQLKDSESGVITVINGFIMRRIFPTLKFAVKDMLSGFLLSARNSNPSLTLARNIPVEDFITHFKGKVSTAFSNLRHSTQTNSRSNYLKDANEGKIPTGFPENVLMVRQNYEVSGQSQYILHNNYRRKDTKEFHYFATRILPCVNARHTNYKAKCGIKMLSQVFTESDEAYALALLINEYESYQFKLLKDKEGATKPRKPFTSSMSGCQQGWNHQGLETFTSILKEVRRRRKENFSISLEGEIMATYNEEAGRQRRKTKKVKVNTEFDFSEHLKGNDLVIGFMKEDKLRADGV